MTIAKRSLSLCTIALLGGMLLHSPPAARADDFDAIVKAAREALLRGDSRTAMQQAQKATALRPDDPFVFALLAAALTDAGQFDAALAAIGKAETLATDANQKTELGQARRGIETKRQAASLISEGTQALKANQFARGAAALAEAYRLLPEVEEAGLEAAKAWWKIEDHAAAAELLRRLSKSRTREIRDEATRLLAEGAAVLDRQYQAEMVAARQALEAGRLPQAEAHISLASRVAPEKTEPSLLLAEVMLRADRKQDAVKALEQAIRLGYFDRASLVGGETFRSLFGEPAYRTLMRNVFGEAVIPALEVHSRLEAARRQPVLGDRLALLDKLQTEFPDRADVREATKDARSRQQSLRDSIASARLLRDPGVRASRARALAAEHPEEPAVREFLQAAVTEEAAHKAANERMAAERLKHAACESQRQEWKFAVINTSDFDLSFDLNGASRTLPSGTRTNHEFVSQPRLIGDECTKPEVPVAKFPRHVDGKGSPHLLNPESGRTYQILDNVGRLTLGVVDAANAGRSFGALGVEENNPTAYRGLFGALSYRSAREALAKHCAPMRCMELLIFWDACVAVWRGRDGGSWESNYAYRPTKEAAVTAARAACSDRALSECQLSMSFCANDK